uniref:AlNc14C131G6974 protein n=1 Tax=Albugo laibachii Nc14 TaxID=890382 RepID=F0WKC2_9STRA|nr:AlNc14C131G6974 [Albugo laibachii Nc14]CCA21849.1 AlNc14C136G7083 [Albugo laibachii Nc14]|eukprot:CCA21849.1 AlNc14C136G7083 [Albugo laibachii Nc14]
MELILMVEMMVLNLARVLRVFTVRFLSTSALLLGPDFSSYKAAAYLIAYFRLWRDSGFYVQGPSS